MPSSSSDWPGLVPNTSSLTICQSGLCPGMFLVTTSSLSYCPLWCQSRSLPDSLKGADTLFHITLQSKSKLFWFDIQPAPWHPLQANGVAQKPGSFPQAETLTMSQTSGIVNLQARTARLSFSPSAGSCLTLSQAWGWFQACQHPIQWYKEI